LDQRNVKCEAISRASGGTEANTICAHEVGERALCAVGEVLEKSAARLSQRFEDEDEREWD
jgi:hypothetical protein